MNQKHIMLLLFHTHTCDRSEEEEEEEESIEPCVKRVRRE